MASRRTRRPAVLRLWFHQVRLYSKGNFPTIAKVVNSGMYLSRCEMRSKLEGPLLASSGP